MRAAAYLGETHIEQIGTAMSSGQGNDVAALLRGAGFSETIIPYLLAQVSHETDGLTSQQATKYNNYSGIKYNKHGTGSGATANGYAIYSSPAKWAQDYHRILSLAPGRPVDATSAQDFLDRLFKNHYFGTGTAAYNTYSAGLNRRLRELLQSSKGTTTIQYQGGAASGNPNVPVTTVTPATNSVVYSQDPGPRQTVIPGGGADKAPGDPVPLSAQNWWDKLPWYGKTGIGIGVGLIVIAAVKN